MLYREKAKWAVLTRASHKICKLGQHCRLKKDSLKDSKRKIRSERMRTSVFFLSDGTRISAPNGTFCFKSLFFCNNYPSFSHSKGFHSVEAIVYVNL